MTATPPSLEVTSRPNTLGRRYLRGRLYWMAAGALAMSGSFSAHAADADSRSVLSAIERDVSAQRRLTERKKGSQAGRRRLAELAIRSAEELEDAAAAGNPPLVDAYRRLLTERLGDVGPRLNQLAGRGHGAAEFALGVLAMRGTPERPDAAACAQFSKALEHGYGGAAFRLSQCLRESDEERSSKLLRQAADAGHLAANELVARDCLSTRPPDAACALARLATAAAGGRPSAQALLGWMYAQGVGGTTDLNRAARLYALAAQAGDPSAQTNLGELYETGRGVRPSAQQALALYKKAAESGYSVGQFNYGRGLAAGLGGKADFEGARPWLEKARAAGIGEAGTVLEWMEKTR